MNPPTVDQHFHQLNGLKRTAECWRYFILCIEQWISGDGKLRAWIKTNARIAAFVAAPVCTVLPVVVAALWELSTCVNALSAIATKLVFLPVVALLLLLSFRLLRR